jgi:hypothetical protein
MIPPREALRRTFDFCFSCQALHPALEACPSVERACEEAEAALEQERALDEQRAYLQQLGVKALLISALCRHTGETLTPELISHVCNNAAIVVVESLREKL